MKRITLFFERSRHYSLPVSKDYRSGYLGIFFPDHNTFRVRKIYKQLSDAVFISGALEISQVMTTSAYLLDLFRLLLPSFSS